MTTQPNAAGFVFSGENHLLVKAFPIARRVGWTRRTTAAGLPEL
jgi:hypothetical protein